MKTTTTPYDLAEHLRTTEEMAAYLQACIEEADGDAGGPGRHCTGPWDDPGGQRLRPFQGEPPQGLIWRVKPEL